MSKTLLAMVGSLRPQSYNRALAREFQARLPEDILWDEPHLQALPWFDESLEAAPPAAVSDFQARLRAASALVIVSPEYNWSVPALIKNALDWGSRPGDDMALGGKWVFVAGASQGPAGTSRMQLALGQIFGCTKNRIWNPHSFLVPFAQKKFDPEGRLTDEATARNLDKHVSGFVALVRGL